MTIRFLLSSILLAATLGLTACGGGGGSSGSSGDIGGPDGDIGGGGDTGGGNGDGNSGDGETSPPEPGPVDFYITSRLPEADAVNRALVTDLVISFNKALMLETVADAVVVTRGAHGVTANIDYSEGESEVILSFEELLAPDSSYRITIGDSLMAEDGEIFPGEQWDFHTTGNVGPTPQAIIDDCMSEENIVMLSAVNKARSQPRMCGSGNFPEVPALAWQCALQTAAFNHSRDMASYNFFSHTGSDGLGAGDRINAAGYSWRSYAENIAAGHRTATGAMESWLASPGHCKNIMSPSVVEMGSAGVEASDSMYSRYWTQVFAHPR